MSPSLSGDSEVWDLGPFQGPTDMSRKLDLTFRLSLLVSLKHRPFLKPHPKSFNVRMSQIERDKDRGVRGRRETDSSGGCGRNSRESFFVLPSRDPTHDRNRRSLKS